MALFDSMLKPGWQNPDPDIRKAAIAELDDESILTEIAKTDTDEDIRAQALALIRSTAILDELLGELGGSLLEQARVQRLKQILPDNDALKDIHDDDLLLRIASLANEEELRLKAVDLLSDSSARYDVALEHPVAKVRLSAAKGIEDLEVLQRLMNATQGKDKAIYRHCKDKVNIHKDAIRHEAERQKKIGLLIEKAIKLSSDVDSPEYAASFRLLQRNWAEVSEHASQQQRDNIQLYLKTCAARVADKAAAVEADAEREATVVRAGESFGEVLEELAMLNGQVESLTRERDLSQLDEKLAGLEVRWQGAAAYARCEKEQTVQYKKQMGEWRQAHSVASALLRKAPKLKKLGTDIDKVDKSDFVVLEQLQQRADHLAAGISWSGTTGVTEPDSLLKLADGQGQLRTRLESLSRDKEKNTARVEEAMNGLRSAIDDGHMKDASRSLNKVRRALKTLPGPGQKRHEKELRSLVVRLDEIKDWQGFAIEPKKVELCEAMESLVDSKEGAEKLAGQIHELQEQWKQLGPLAPQRDQELWRRFSKAADKAFKPCKEAFAQQAKERKANLARRMEVVEGLRKYEKEVDWVQAESSDFDWKAVLRKLDDTRSGMRAIKPVGQKGAARSEGALKKVSDRIYGHISEEYDRNIQQKEDLISRAQKLSEVENLDQAIEQAERNFPH